MLRNKTARLRSLHKLPYSVLIFLFCIAGIVPLVRYDVAQAQAETVQIRLIIRSVSRQYRRIYLRA